MPEKDINAQEAPATSVAIDGYKEIASGGSKTWDKVKKWTRRVMVTGATLATVSLGVYAFGKNIQNSVKEKIRDIGGGVGLTALVLSGAVRMGYSEENESNNSNTYQVKKSDFSR